MSTLRLNWMIHPPAEVKGGAVSVGNFDGVHRGHHVLIDNTIQLAREIGGPAVAVTFDPPPLALLNPAALQPSLTTPYERAELLHAAGIDHVIILETDAGLLSLTPEAFFQDVLLRLLGARAIAEGSNFRFGRNRVGTTSTLASLCQVHGLRFQEVAMQPQKGEVISSSRIRQAVNQGDLRTAAVLLGRPYRSTGIVEPGLQRGRTIGFPTANVGMITTLLPAEGVYAARAVVGSGSFRAAVNLGPNPTFGESSRKCEVHLLDFQGDLYGQSLTIHWDERLRETRKFASVDELTNQLRQDVQQIRERADL